MIRLGVDPGSAHVGLVITAGDAVPLRLLHRETIEVGTVVPLATPRTGVRRDGTPWTMSHHRVITGEDVARIASRCVELAREHGVERVLTEHVNDVFLRDFPERSHTSRATCINRATWVEGEIRGELRALGFDVAEGIRMVSARARVRPARGATATGLPAAIQAGIDGWPERSGEHERDAAVLCLYDVLPPRVSGRRKLGEPRPPKPAKVPRVREAKPPPEPAGPCRHCGHEGRGRHRRGCITARINVLRRAREAEAPPVVRAPLVVVPVVRDLLLPVPYSPARGYEAGAVVDHPRFGRGVVEQVVDRTKVSVRFGAEMRTLAHAGVDKRGEVCRVDVGAEPPF